MANAHQSLTKKLVARTQPTAVVIAMSKEPTENVKKATAPRKQQVNSITSAWLKAYFLCIAAVVL